MKKLAITAEDKDMLGDLIYTRVKERDSSTTDLLDGHCWQNHFGGCREQRCVHVNIDKLTDIILETMDVDVHPEPEPVDTRWNRLSIYAATGAFGILMGVIAWNLWS